MKIYKIQQGSSIENLKCFIYLTNEYGVPSDEFIDGFLDNFYDSIINKQFYIRKHEDELESLWTEIKEECKENKVQYKENYGLLFYMIISEQATDIIKNKYGLTKPTALSSNSDIANYRNTFKKMLLNFDKLVDEDGIDAMDLYFENKNIDIYTDPDVNMEYIKIERKTHNKTIKARLYKNSSIKINEDSQITLQKYIYKSPSGAANAVSNNVGSENTRSNGWSYWIDEKGRPIGIYRTQSIASEQASKVSIDTNKLNNSLDKLKNEPIKPDNIDNDALIKAFGNKSTDIDTSAINQSEPVEQVEQAEQSYKQYKLRNIAFIGNELELSDSIKATTKSLTRIEIDGTIYDIGEYIHKNNISIDNIRMGAFRFKELYERI